MEKINKQRRLIIQSTFIIISLFIFIINNGAFANSEIIYNKNTNYIVDLKFAGIGKITYFVDYYNEELENISLYQTDGTKSGTAKVIAKNSNNIDFNIFNPVQLFVNHNNLIMSRFEKNKKFISILDTKQNRIYDVDTIDYSTYNNLNFFNFDSNLTLIHFAPNNNYSTKIYFLNTQEKKLYPYNFPMKYYIELIEIDKLVLRDTLGNISLLNPKANNDLWNMKQSQLSNYSHWFYSQGIYLLNKDTAKKSLFVNYYSGKIDSISTIKIPTPFKPIMLEYGIFSVFDSTIRRISIIRTDKNYKIIDTLSKDFTSYFINKDYFYYFKISKSTFNNIFYYYPLLMDLYSYNFLTKKVEMLVPDCVYDFASNFVRSKFKDGRIVFSLQTFKYGNELFVSDGTSAGTKMLKDISTGPFNGLSLSYYYQIDKNDDDNSYYFYANSSEYGKSIWQTDGSVEGTIPILSLEPNEIGLKSNDIKFYVNNKLFIQDLYNLHSSDIRQADKVRKKYDYKIIDNIFSRESTYSNFSHFYSSSFFKDNQNNFYVTGQNDATNVRYTFCYLKDQICDSSIRDYRTTGYIIKYNQYGDRLFTKYINYDMFGDNIATSVDSLMNIYCLYKHNDSYKGINDFGALTKFDKNGDSLWTIKFNPSDYIDNIYCLETDKDNNVYALFSYKSFSLSVDSINLRSKVSPEYVLFKISSDGKIQEYKQFNHTEYYSKILMTIINDKVILAFSAISEQGWSSCKYSPFSNIIYMLDLDLSVVNKKTFIGDDFNYITSVQKGFGDDILISGTYRGSLDLLGNVLNSSKDGNCNLQTSYIALLDKELNIKYVKDLNPEKYIINSAYLTKDNNIYTVGTCSSCKIDTLIYPNWLGYPKYKTSISTRRFDYWGNEIASFNYSKQFGGNWNLSQPRVIELNNKPLIYDIYNSNLGLIPELSVNYYIDFLLLIQPELISAPTNSETKNSRYSIVSDIFGNYYIKINKDNIFSEEIEIKLYDLTGKFMSSMNLILVNGMQQIDLPGNLPFGFYLVQINDGEIIENHKLIK